MKILVKYPTRDRPKQFLRALGRVQAKQSTKNVTYLVSYDLNDRTWNKQLEDVVSKRYDNVIFVGGNSKGKIDACNRDVNEYEGDWDIIVLMSDDMICEKVGWDAILIEKMNELYADTDGVLFFNDGFCGKKLNTMCILGRKYYERFGCIYHPSYVSLFSDNEFMEVADMLGKQTYFPQVLFKHEHPINVGSMKDYDRLYKSNDRFYNLDKKTYETRKKQSFA